MNDPTVPAQTVHHPFSYGTLQLPEVQISQFGRLLDGSPDALPGHRMTTIQITDPAVIKASGTDRHPLAVVSPDLEDAVEGQVFAISDAELAATDAYEVDDYARVWVTLRSGIRAWVCLERTNGAPGATDAPASGERGGAVGVDDGAGDPVSVREWLRSLEVFAGPLADFDPAGAPAEPVDLFLGWLREAVAAGVCGLKTGAELPLGVPAVNSTGCGRLRKTGHVRQALAGGQVFRAGPLRAKCTQRPELAEILISTGDAVIRYTGLSDSSSRRDVSGNRG
ncbi:gamma-glutamylcyclotransferase [Streptomyces sp. NPDC086549]|uniref:gamma-glutamylcyclotransferase family protein n=1 Tax=Streptomyces sp. NPDC086549 TaxID=3365752 RepID=UPI0037F1DF26